MKFRYLYIMEDGVRGSDTLFTETIVAHLGPESGCAVFDLQEGKYIARARPTLEWEDVPIWEVVPNKIH